MYTVKNFKTKKELKAAVNRRNELLQSDGNDPTSVEYNEYAKLTRWLEVYAPGLGQPPANGNTTVEGPHYPEPHRWYAEVTVENYVIVKAR